MILDITHKGLKRFFLSESKSGIQAQHAERLRLILFRLNTASSILDMGYPGSGLHSLKGGLQGYWSVKVSGNWRITFRFENGDAFDVDYQDYH